MYCICGSISFHLQDPNPFHEIDPDTDPGSKKKSATFMDNSQKNLPKSQDYTFLTRINS